MRDIKRVRGREREIREKERKREEKERERGNEKMRLRNGILDRLEEILGDCKVVDLENAENLM
eukprot:149476-Amorphochlora_amoeboformis.AAC.1